MKINTNATEKNIVLPTNTTQIITTEIEKPKEVIVIDDQPKPVKLNELMLGKTFKIARFVPKKLDQSVYEAVFNCGASLLNIYFLHFRLKFANFLFIVELGFIHNPFFVFVSNR
jgi:hypothetical protein